VGLLAKVVYLLESCCSKRELEYTFGYDVGASGFRMCLHLHWRLFSWVMISRFDNGLD
jgi:hypothetical protein